ncbi:hypothetical protein BH09VER1_BH09VER1_19020 [soil metagenome]
MKKSLPRGFTLIELLIVISIIAILVALTIPEASKVTERARSITCMNHLKNIGVAVTSYLGEHDNTFPFVELNTNDPLYTTNYQALPMETELAPYGVDATVLKCPSDVAGPNYYASRSNSYQWCPIADGESWVDLTLYGRRGGTRVVKPSRVTICMDYDSVHFGRANRLYADGHVKYNLKGR